MWLDKWHAETGLFAFAAPAALVAEFDLTEETARRIYVDWVDHRRREGR